MASSTIVCRNFMSSCFDPQETIATTLKLKVLAHQNPNHHHHHHQTSVEDLGFINTHRNKPHYSSQQDDAYCSHHHHQYSCSNSMKPYNSFARLSPKSLEMCTENLGSETGSDTMFNTSNINQEPEPTTKHDELVPEKSKTVKKLQKSPCDRTVRNTKNCTFPPPLTTMSGSSHLQVTRHRENGRLIIEAVERPLRNSLQAERSCGRLRLSFQSTPVDGGVAAGKEEERSENEVVGDRDNNNNHSKYHQWMSIRCKEGGHGGDNRGDDMNWNKSALWVVTS